MILGKQNRTESLESIAKKIDLDPQNIPKHIAIIMDGNGRWAKRRFLPRVAGHKEGAEALRKAIKSCVKLNIHYLSVYAFSTENWKRDTNEVSFLMKFFQELIKKEVPSLKKEGVRVKILGHKENLDTGLLESIKYAESETDSNTTLQLNLMLNYGSRQEIITMCQRAHKRSLEDPTFQMTEESLSQLLYTEDVPDPEILIRTSGEKRISNYLLWQIAYSELFFTEGFWPDFNEEELITILRQYQKRNRRFGGL